MVDIVADEISIEDRVTAVEAHLDDLRLGPWRQVHEARLDALVGRNVATRARQDVERLAQELRELEQTVSVMRRAMALLLRRNGGPLIDDAHSGIDLDAEPTSAPGAAGSAGV